MVSEILTLCSGFKKNRKKKLKKLEKCEDRQCNESAVVLISSLTRHKIGPNGKNLPKFRLDKSWNSYLRQSDKFQYPMEWPEMEISWHLFEFLGMKAQRVYTNFLADFSHLESQCAMKSSFILVFSLCATLTITEASGNRSVLVNFCPVLCEKLQFRSKISKHS